METNRIPKKIIAYKPKGEETFQKTTEEMA
jgi:hypothetical protein